MLQPPNISIRTTILSAFILMMLASCSSSKKFARDPIYDAGRDKSSQSFKTDRNIDRPSRQLLDEARRWLGTRYVYGGHSRSGTDCSGFIMEVYRSAADIKLPRSTDQQRKFCKSIKKSEIDIGDLIFFTSRKGKGRVSHVGLYIGDGKMIHASSSKGVIVSALDERYYATNYHSSGRVTAFRKRPAEAPRETSRPVSVPRVSRQAIKEIRVEKLDSLLNQKIDSIYTDMLD